MDKKSKSTNKSYLAHVDHETQRTQCAKEHFENVAAFAQDICPIPELEVFAYLAGILHDAGKLGTKNQDDLEKILEFGEEAHQLNLDHSTAGGKIVQELIEEPVVSELISTVIYFHHGVSDCIEMETGQSLQERRKKKDIEYELIRERFFSMCDQQKLKEKRTEALVQYKNINNTIASFLKQCKGKSLECGNGYFFMGMYLRVLLSLLIDADWTDTSCFFQDTTIEKRISVQDTQTIWQQCIKNFEEYMSEEIINNPMNGNSLNSYRQEISDACKKAADTNKTLYRLTVPTGAGKTLSSLRFALYHALKEKKQHIIYVSPYISLLVQNAEEIRKAIKTSGIVLEHHCNIVCENGEEEKYKTLTETWDAPIIVTTAVQVLNTLFSDQKSYIRRMHTLCNSVIIFDEVQAIPVKCTELFNEAVNFLSQFGKTTVVLCSATQPTYAALRKNAVYTCTEMAGNFQKYEEPFRRTNIIDATKLYPGGMKIDDLKEFTLEKMQEYTSVLVIVNTTACALNLFKALNEKDLKDYKLFHISNNMCPQHKLDTLKQIKDILKDRNQKIICVSTQVVEAGVNFSYGCVIRSKAGLDNVIQSAGRCNRHKEFSNFGTVYIVQMNEKAEDLEKLREIKTAQQALEKVLDDFRINSEIFGERLDSQEAIKAYYSNYFQQLRTDETKFPCKEYSTNLVELLGKNAPGRKQYERLYKNKLSQHSFAQAFFTAGEQFEVISDDYKIPIIVPYNDEAKELITKLTEESGKTDEKKQILRKLQRYTVSISPYRKEKLNNALYQVCEGEILILCDGYYDEKTGVSDEPVMKFNMI